MDGNGLKMVLQMVNAVLSMYTGNWCMLKFCNDRHISIIYLNYSLNFVKKKTLPLRFEELGIWEGQNHNSTIFQNKCSIVWYSRAFMPDRQTRVIDYYYRSHIHMYIDKQVLRLCLDVDALVKRFTSPFSWAYLPPHRMHNPSPPPLHHRLPHPPTRWCDDIAQNGTANFRTLGAMTTTVSSIGNCLSSASAYVIYVHNTYVCMYVCMYILPTYLLSPA